MFGTRGRTRSSHGARAAAPGLGAEAQPSTAGAAAPYDLPAGEPVVRFERVSLAFDEKVVLDEVSFELMPGRMKIVLGASGAGKSTILRLLLGLLRPDAGRIFVLGKRVDDASEAGLMEVRGRLGMVFQEGALFDSLTVRENVGFRLFEGTRLPLEQVDERVREVLGFVGLADFGERMPSELSGGERRRVAIARALASHPQVLLYDEPTTGLDPITAVTIDHEIIKLRDLERVSSIIVTHQLRDAFYIATHEARLAEGVPWFTDAWGDTRDRTEFMMLKDGRVAFRGRADELRASRDPYLEAFLSGTVATGASPVAVPPKEI